jgi:hypothetical protein
MTSNEKAPAPSGTVRGASVELDSRDAKHSSTGTAAQAVTRRVHGGTVTRVEQRRWVARGPAGKVVGTYTTEYRATRALSGRAP